MKLRACSAALAISLTLACDDKSPSAPTVLPPPVERQPAGIMITRVELIGPEIVPLGETVQFSLLAHLSDGTTVDVSSDARWFGATDLVAWKANQATGYRRGDGSIVAEHEGGRASKLIMVIPEGSFRLNGKITEADLTLPGPVGGARVEVVGGAGSGLIETTDSFGNYGLFGVVGNTVIRVTREGYSPVTRSLHVAGHQTVDIALPLIHRRPDISGQYELTITAAADCEVRPGLHAVPASDRIQKFAASLRQTSSELTAVVDGPGVTMPFNRPIPGKIEATTSGFTHAVLTFIWYQGELPYFVRQMNGRSVVADGEARIPIVADRMSATFAGQIHVFDSTDSDFWRAPNAWCESANHEIVLSRTR